MAVYINKEQTFFAFVGVVLGAVKGLHLTHLSFDKKSVPNTYIIEVENSGETDGEQELMWTISMNDESFVITCNTTGNIIFSRDKGEHESITYWFDLQYSSFKMARLIDDIRQGFADYIKDALVLIAQKNACEDAQDRIDFISVR